MQERGHQEAAERMTQPTTSSELTCRFCDHPLTHSLVDLGLHPLCEDFRADAEAPETFYPLHPRVCERCFLVQIPSFVPVDDIFREYAYFSSYSTAWLEHARQYCEQMTHRLDLTGDSFVVELASNDGYLLRNFVDAGVPCLGVEPSYNVAKVAVEKHGVETLTEFFGVELATQLAEERGKADLIAGNNVLAQVPDLHDFVGGIAILLADTGTCTLEFPHLVQLMQQNQFDTIYHEHFGYFSLYFCEKLAEPGTA